MIQVSSQQNKHCETYTPTLSTDLESLNKLNLYCVLSLDPEDVRSNF